MVRYHAVWRDATVEIISILQGHEKATDSRVTCHQTSGASGLFHCLSAQIARQCIKFCSSPPAVASPENNGEEFNPKSLGVIPHRPSCRFCAAVFQISESWFPHSIKVVKEYGVSRAFSIDESEICWLFLFKFLRKCNCLVSRLSSSFGVVLLSACTMYFRSLLCSSSERKTIPAVVRSTSLSAFCVVRTKTLLCTPCSLTKRFSKKHNC